MSHGARERRPLGRPPGGARELPQHHSTGFNPDLDYGQEQADAQRLEQVSDLRFRRTVERLHRLGPRPFFEVLAERGTARLIRTDIERQVERYAALDLDTLHQLGGDRFPPLALHCISRGQ